MSREWKPGDVAMIFDRVAVRAEADCQACKDIRDKTPGEHWHDSKMRLGHGFDVNARLLVVIDPEDREQVTRLLIANAAEYEVRLTALQPEEISAMQAALRSLVAPPKPDEPTGLGAVVEAEDGAVWVRAAFGSRAGWSEVNAVKVLSEGVTP